MYTQVSVKETELSKSFASGVVRPVFFLFWLVSAAFLFKSLALIRAT